MRGGGWSGWRGAAVALLVLHGVFLLVTLGPGLLADRPPMWGDHGVVYYRAQLEVQLLRETGSWLGYDAQLFAGYPHGAVDNNSPGANRAVRVLSWGVGPPRAFGLWALGALFVVPLALAAAGRALGAATSDRLLVAGLGVLLLYGDAFARHLLRYGSVAWLLNAPLLLAFAGCFARLCERPTRARFVRAAALTPLFCVHALTPLSVALWTTCYLLARRRLAACGWALALGAVGLALNAWWIAPLVRQFASTSGVMSEALNTPVTQLARDLLGAVAPGQAYLGGTSGVRWALAVLGAWGLWRARSSPLASAAAVAAVGFLALGYVGGALSLTQRLQAHRYVIPGVMALLPFAPAGARALWCAGRRGRAALIALTCLAVWGGAWEVRHASQQSLHPARPTPATWAVIEHLDARPRAGRVLIEVLKPYDNLTAVAASFLDGPALGYPGPLLVGPYGVATWNPKPNLFLGWPPPGRERFYPPVQGPEAARRLQRYGVSEVVVLSEPGRALMRSLPPGTLGPEVARFGPYTVYRLAHPAGLIAAGAGVVEARPGRLVLRELSGPVTLRFHYVEGLTAVGAPEVRVERVEVPGVPAGFIRVDPAGRRAVTLAWRPGG